MRSLNGPLHVVLANVASRIIGRERRAGLCIRVWHAGDVSKRFEAPRYWLTLALRKEWVLVGGHG